MYSIKRLEKEALRDISKTDARQTIFTTYEWICFLEKNRKANPVVLELSNENNEVCGYFVGLTFRKFGIKILGSPFEQWMSSDMGFIKFDKFDMAEGLETVKTYAFKKLKCMYVQIVDKEITKEFADDKKLTYTIRKDLYKDISADPDAIMKSFKKGAKCPLKYAINHGNEIVKVEPSHEFADIFYDFLIEVFAKQNLKPFYPKEKIYDIFDAFKDNEENILCYKALSPEKEVIATCIEVGFKDWCYFMQESSSKDGLKYKPNEHIVWYGINYWKDKGCTKFDMMGFSDYKLKFVPQVVETPVVFFAKYTILIKLKDFAKKLISKVREPKKEVIIKNNNI